MQASQSNRPAAANQPPEEVTFNEAAHTFKAGWWHHMRLGLIVSLRGGQLDRQLAAGVSQGATDVLALRAQQLTRRRSRLRLAEQLARAAFEAEDTTPGAVRPHPRDLLAARSVLDVLDQRLRDPGPVTARGVALLRVLISDKASPLHRPSEPGELGSQLRSAAAALEPVKRDARLAEPTEARVRSLVDR